MPCLSARPNCRSSLCSLWYVGRSIASRKRPFRRGSRDWRASGAGRPGSGALGECLNNGAKHPILNCTVQLGRTLAQLSRHHQPMRCTCQEGRELTKRALPNWRHGAGRAGCGRYLRGASRLRHRRNSVVRAAGHCPKGIVMLVRACLSLWRASEGAGRERARWDAGSPEAAVTTCTCAYAASAPGPVVAGAAGERPEASETCTSPTTKAAVQGGGLAATGHRGAAA